MKSLIWLPLSSAALLVLSSCADKNSLAGNDPYGTGPFDSQGNYREDWADDPTKWRRPGSRKSQSQPDEAPLFAANDKPPANATPLPPAGTSKPKPRPEPVSSSSAAPKPTAKPKPVVAQSKPKPKPKPKPTSTRYVVKKGDTLSAIASRNGSSVKAIQRANGITGTLIRPGQKLVVPKR
jgi:nucleoid-associated protein YgaU